MTMTIQKHKPNYNTNLLDLIIEEQQAKQHRQLQEQLPAELHDWELFFERLGGVSSYCCINYDHNIITSRHPTKHRAVEEAYDYALLFELLPVAILRLRHPAAHNQPLPARYREMLIDHERRTHGQAQSGSGQAKPTTTIPVHA